MSGSGVDEVDKHVLRKYEITQKLGKGAYAVVFKAIDKKTKQVVALKKIFDAFQNATDAQRTFREIMYLMALKTPKSHPNIIQLQNFMKAENDRDIYLVFDFMETDLHAVIRADILQPVHKQFIVYQSLKALKYCHTGGLLHRDLKPSNLLLNEECILKVADFGLARTLKEVDKAVDNDSVLTDYVATRWYRAPEIILGSTSYTKAVDMWALGCIVAEMFIGKPLLPGSSTNDQLERILDICGKPSDRAIASMKSTYAKTMIESIVEKRKADGSKKPFADASEQHRKQQLKALMPSCDDLVVSVVCGMLDVDPSARMSVTGALEHPYMKPFVRENEAECDIFADDPTQRMTIPIDDDTKFDVDRYRTKLYEELKKLRKDTEGRQNKFFSLPRRVSGAFGKAAGI